MLRNKSKQMGSMAKVAWHDEEGGGRRTAAQKYTGHFRNDSARAMCCNTACKLANPPALLGNKSQLLAHFTS